MINLQSELCLTFDNRRLRSLLRLDQCILTTCIKHSTLERRLANEEKSVDSFSPFAHSVRVR